MSDTAVLPPSAEEVEALRLEVERLKEENERLSGVASPEKKARHRTNWAIVLVVIGALALAVAVVWYSAQ